jgi:hypothetical protein
MTPHTPTGHQPDRGVCNVHAEPPLSSDRHAETMRVLFKMLFVGVFGCIAQQAVADTTTHFGGWQVFEGLTNPGNFPICMATSPEANIGRLVISFATRGDYPGKALLLITRQREWSNILETAVGITLQFDDGRPVSSEWMTTKDLRVLARVEPAGNFGAFALGATKFGARTLLLNVLPTRESYAIPLYGLGVAADELSACEARHHLLTP